MAFAGDNNSPAASAKFGRIEKIAIDSRNSIFISDNGYLRLRRIDNQGLITTIVGMGIVLFAYMSVAILIYLTCIGSGTQALIDPPFSSPFRNLPLRNIVGIATSSKGDVYYVEWQRIVKLTAKQ
jgi:hypothetical protein